MKAFPLIIIAIILSLAFFVTTSFLYAGDLDKRIEEAIDIVDEILTIPEKGIPYDLLMTSKAIALFPNVVKGGFIVGGRFGRGIICAFDDKTGKWSAPAFFTLGGGSFGFQAGVQSIDLILVIMNKKGLEALLKSKVTLGGDISVAAGPVGRRAETSSDLLLRAEITSYSRSRGFFAGVSVDGATIMHDRDANRTFYGNDFSAREILLEGKATPPPAAQNLINKLAALLSKK